MKRKCRLWILFITMLFLFSPSFQVRAEKGGPSVITSLTIETIYEGAIGISGGRLEVDGILAFCIERSMRTPKVGTTTSEWEPVTDELLRKVLYYGYNGPENMGYSYMETTLAAAEANGDGHKTSSLGKNMLLSVSIQKAPPEEFQVWKVATYGNGTQDLAFYTMASEGYLKLEKTSADTTITDGNDKYTLEGALYGIYSDAACTVLVGELLTDENGESNKVTLNKGTYYVKEIRAPEGYEINAEVEEVEVLYAQTSLVKVSDVPIADNFISNKFPETGSAGMLCLGITGTLFILLGWKRKGENK